jgi:hypothetical protein
MCGCDGPWSFSRCTRGRWFLLVAPHNVRYEALDLSVPERRLGAGTSRDASENLRLHLELHDDSEIRVKAVVGFRVAHCLYAWADLVLGQDSEAKMLIERPVPRDVPEGRERESRETFRDGPAFYVLDQGAANALTLVVRCDAHLLDVPASVDNVHEDVTDRLARIVHGDPGPAVIGIPGEHLKRSRFVVSDMVKPVLSVPLPRGPFDIAKNGQVIPDSRPDLQLLHH